MSQAGANSGSGSGGGSITQIDGDISFVTGPIISLTANNTAGSTVYFEGDGVNAMTFNVSDVATSNTLIGANAGNSIITGTENTGVGYASGSALTSGIQNALFCQGAGGSLTTGSNNAMFGHSAGGNFDVGSRATMIGSRAGNNAESGLYLICIGYEAGTNYTSTEASNICIGNAGVLAESNVIRLGTQGSGAGQQNVSYIVGPILSTSNGTASNPAFSFSSEPDTGLYLSGSNEVSLTAGGSQNLVVSQFVVSANKLFNNFSGFTWNYTNPGAYPYSVLDASDCVVFVDTSSARTINLPNAATAGRIFLIKDVTGSATANNITVTTPGGTVTIDGATSQLINVSYGSMTVIFNGTNYFIL